jgi:hypothetical protein
VSDVNPTTAQRDSFGPVGAQPTFQEPSDYRVGQHVVFHHFDGKDYEAVISSVWGPGSDVANRWVAHLDVGGLANGHLKNISEASREDTQPEGTFSLKPKSVDGVADDRDSLVRNRSAGTVLPVRADENPRPPAGERDLIARDQRRLTMEDFKQSVAPADAPQEPYTADALAEVRDDQVQREETEENRGDEGLDTPANYITDNRLEQGDPIPPADPDSEPDPRVGTTQSDDDEHVKEAKRAKK